MMFLSLWKHFCFFFLSFFLIIVARKEKEEENERVQTIDLDLIDESFHREERPSSSATI